MRTNGVTLIATATARTCRIKRCIGILHIDEIGIVTGTLNATVVTHVPGIPSILVTIQISGSGSGSIRSSDGDIFVKQIGHMWDSQPNWSDAQLKSITAPVEIADGDHDEAIKRAHTEYLAATIPGAGLLILPNTSHFAFLQDPALFNAAMLDFLDNP